MVKKKKKKGAKRAWGGGGQYNAVAWKERYPRAALVRGMGEAGPLGELWCRVGYKSGGLERLGASSGRAPKIK